MRSEEGRRAERSGEEGARTTRDVDSSEPMPRRLHGAAGGGTIISPRRSSTDDVERRGVRGGSRSVGRRARVVAAVGVSGRGDAQQRGSGSERSDSNPHARVHRLASETPRDRQRSVAFGHVTVEVHGLAGEHGLVEVEGFDVWGDWREYVRRRER